jgi:uncharacterized protein Yka (UPF0111/DUF47 family)
MKRVAVIIKEPSMQYEGLRTSLGLLLEDIDVQMIVLDHEIEEMNEAYADNLSFLDEMGGNYYSNHIANVTQYGFQPIERQDLPALLQECDIIIPF